MTSITVTLPDEVAAEARKRGLLEPGRLTPIVCEALTRAARGAESQPRRVEDMSLAEALMSLAGVAGPGLPEDFAERHDHYIHGTDKR